MTYVRGNVIAALAGAALLLAASTAGAQALQPGVAVQVDLPAQTFVANYYIDVDANARQLTFSANGSADIDLFVRYGTPFPTKGDADFPTSPQLVSEDTLVRWSQYHSFSAGTSESISVLPSGRVPLAAGRWYVAVINSATAAASPATTLTATVDSSPQVAAISVDFNSPGSGGDVCDVAPWTDPTTAAPVNGNPGTTLGQQRQNALKYAVEQITQQLQPPVPITIHACWDHLGGDADKAVIARASPATFLVDEPVFGGYVLPLRYTWYSITEAVRIGGTSQCGLVGGSCGGTANEEIAAVFNSDIGSATVIGGRPYYYGYIADPSSFSIDFISVAMHELTHGMGFIGLANTDASSGPIGARAGIANNSIAYQNLEDGPFDDVFDVNAAIVDPVANTYRPFMGYEVNGSGDAARAAALVSNNGLRWSDPTAVESPVNQNRSLPGARGFPLLYAPDPLSNGSTLSHTYQDGDLMNPSYPFPPPRTLGLAAPMLAPLGWSTAAAAAPQFATPFPSNWFDRSHGGHGIDFQLARRDAVYGDVYILVFYTYDANGKPEWYLATGHVVDGVFVADLNGNGSTLLYSTYGANHGPGQLNATPQASPAGTVVVDFNQADKSPACRDADRSGAPLLGVMSWRIGNDSADWCMEPSTTLAQHPAPDFNGHWFSPNDSGWGMEVLDFDGNANASSLFVLIYYPDAAGLPTWALASGTLASASATANLQVLARANGYCRTCAAPPAATTNAIGTMTLRLNAPAPGGTPTGTATFTINYPGGGSFSRSNDPVTLLSLPNGQ